MKEACYLNLFSGKITENYRKKLTSKERKYDESNHRYIDDSLWKKREMPLLYLILVHVLPYDGRFSPFLRIYAP